MSDVPEKAQEDATKPQYRPISGIAESQQAIDEVIAAAVSTIRVFDFSLTNRGFNSPARTDRLREFLAQARSHRLLIALHDTGLHARVTPTAGIELTF